MGNYLNPNMNKRPAEWVPLWGYSHTGTNLQTGPLIAPKLFHKRHFVWLEMGDKSCADR